MTTVISQRAEPAAEVASPLNKPIPPDNLRKGTEMSNITNYAPGEIGSSDASANSEQLAREQAIKQIERRRRFRVSFVVSGIGMALLVATWAITEYRNAGGWPTQGFSESSGLHDVWNSWIIYPFVAWVLGTAAHAWFVYLHGPVSESEVRREIQRQARVAQETGKFTK